MSNPDIYIFNPTCELAIANNSVSYMPPERLRVFENDLATMPMWLATTNDIVICRHPPDNQFADRLLKANIQLPSFQTLSQLTTSQTTINQILPWGWSLTLHHYLKPIKPHCSQAFKQSINFEWTPDKRQFFSRLSSVRLVEKLLPLIKDFPELSIPKAPIIIDTPEKADDAITGFKGKVVFKSPWSSSGRGVMMIDTSANRLPDLRWIKGIINQQGLMIAETLLNKLADLSFHFAINNSGTIDYLGHTFFKTDNAGKFKGCYLETEPDEIFKHKWSAGLRETINIIPEILKTALSQLSIHQHYTGVIGIDTVWHQSEDNHFVLHPAIEINLRHTMGLVNIKLRHQMHPQAKGYWQITQFQPHAFSRFCSDNQTIKQMRLMDNKLINGFLPLTPDSGTFGAWLELS